ncbi:MFS general substrate transporter [Laetiporus sulphureus 93-53]|uniref:MFS general substrate transporter n=1 Tax=Laetiporus sulphureus 93-53 TaxID=1314785 RepID=A0A165DHJ7_9APHY|nr:MFS general substrate transporter [Laetiporus sulphureus 93-53]KZT04894.1 MFS general substrate transporter [Laetiporus sulphureus 93-53]
MPSSPHVSLEIRPVSQAHIVVYPTDSTDNIPEPLVVLSNPEDITASQVWQDKQEGLVVSEEQDDWSIDRANPRNWSLTRKWVCTAIVSLYSFVSPLSSSMMAPALPDISKHYGITSSSVQALTLSIFLLSFAIGPLFFGPLSEMYGRAWVLHLANILLLGCNIGCAFAPSTAALIIFRFFAGLGGSASVGIGGSVVSDIFAERDRGSAMAIMTIGPLVGPTVGPVAGGFITATIGFKWVFVVIAAVCGVASLIGIPFLRESYGPVVLRRRLSSTKDSTAELPGAAAAVPTSARERARMLWTNFSRPAVLLTRSSICFMLSMYLAFIYGTYYLMFATFPELFSSVYGFGPGIGGLTYLGLGIGFILGSFLGARYGDALYRYIANRTNNGVGKPEMRIPGLVMCSVFVPIGLFWYGWSAQARTHWILPIIGTGFFGLGLMMAYLSIQLYLVDAFEYAASALAAASVLRSLFGFGFPLFAGPMFAALGDGPGNSLLAGLSIVIGVPFPIYLYFRGEKIRQGSKYTK